VQANPYSNYSPLEGQISPTPKRLIKFPTWESVLDFPSVGKPKQLPDDQQFTCPNCSEITTGFPCEHCGYDEEGLYELD
jgi:hypothetical protein